MSARRFFTAGPYIMGIVNVTPDSFSDGGLYQSTEDAVRHATRLINDGASIIDIGGESTKPGADPVDPVEEQKRVIPVVERVRKDHPGTILSIDTRNAATMQAALARGATMINDISALTYDSHAMSVAAASDCMICLMHMLGTPETMQIDPRYDDVVEEVFGHLASRIATCEAAGIDRRRLVVDPGIGFGKTLAHNLRLLANLDLFRTLDVPVMLGASRKGFIAGAAGKSLPEDRVGGSIAAALQGLAQGVQIFRVHDVAETRQAFEVWKAIESGRGILPFDTDTPY